MAHVSSQARESGPKSIIVDETTDISKLVQVGVCLRFVYDGEIKEPFVGFYETTSTDGETLYQLVKTVFRDLDLKLEEIVGECFDGASNMSGVHRGLAARMKETSAQAIYIHCYAHLLNLAVQDTLTNVEVLRNALGTIQSLFNFIEGSAKRHAIFQAVAADENSLVTTLKSQSKTRWSCRWEAVKSVRGQLPQIISALLQLLNEPDCKTYTDSCALLNAVCDFNFVFGLNLLKIILSTTSSLSSDLQSQTMSVITARKTAEMTIKTLTDCRNDESFNAVWDLAHIQSREIKEAIKDTRFSFKEAHQPRRRKPPERNKALVGETGAAEPAVLTEKDHYRVTGYYQSMDLVIAELNSRFDKNEQDVLCALGDVVLSKSPGKTSYNIVSEHYNVDGDLLETEKSLFMNFLSDTEELDLSTEQTLSSVVNIVQILRQNDLDAVLPVFWNVTCILAAIPATSCSVERSFSGLRRMKTYLRSTMGQDRLNNLAIININRAVSNLVVHTQMDEMIDTFGRRKNRDSMFF